MNYKLLFQIEQEKNVELMAKKKAMQEQINKLQSDLSFYIKSNKRKDELIEQKDKQLSNCKIYTKEIEIIGNTLTGKVGIYG